MNVRTQRSKQIANKFLEYCKSKIWLCKPEHVEGEFRKFNCLVGIIRIFGRATNRLCKCCISTAAAFLKSK